MVLYGCERQFQNVSHEVRSNGTTSTLLWFQVSNCRHGHVVLKVEHVEPLLIAMHRAGTKAFHTVLPSVRIDFLSALLKPLWVLIEAAIVIQIVNVALKASLANAGN